MVQADERPHHDETTGTHRHLNLNFTGRGSQVNQQAPLSNPQSNPAPPEQNSSANPGSMGQGQDLPRNEQEDIVSADGDIGSPSSDTSQAKEVERTLRARMDWLESQLLQPAHKQIQPYISGDDYNDLRTRAAALWHPEERRPTIPDMIPGFQASPLTQGSGVGRSPSQGHKGLQKL
ncbi:hypothetical protein M422DRAFT_71491 [Sphaerobolus stellatus SS14]|uniref:Uncharacterized protein n=1 Tax=Sphaerobolus stellatus (strain SS14) TaxID=990650 RepID=A0A0C9U1T5_SPHS4|nr:hypothetical protein M422DRAFT_71491 [Sphaerobolus stellatus SS14]